MENAAGSWGSFYEFEIRTRSGDEKVIMDYVARDIADEVTRWGIFKDRQGRKLARAGKEDGQVFLHKLLVNIPKGSRLEWKNGNTLDLRRSNLQLVDKDGTVTELEPQRIIEPAYKTHEARLVAKQAQEESETGITYEEGYKHAMYLIGEEAEPPKEKPKSDVKGVYWHKNSERWHAAAFHGGKRYSLGYFQEMKDAELEVTLFRSAGPDSPALKRNQNKTKEGNE